MKKTLSTMAAAAVLVASTAAAPVFAQTTPAAPATTAPASPAAPSAGTTAPAVDASSAAGTYLTQQAENQISANDYIGKSVYNANNESIGSINDLIFEDQGGVVAAVIGVGGFLGIAEKDVAVPIEKVTMNRDAANNNEVRLTTTETADTLKGAPEYQTLADQRSATDSSSTSATTPATGGATSTMPAAGGATSTPTEPAK
jgi:sporulation protein YlmC with PRC-barrel domain